MKILNLINLKNLKQSALMLKVNFGVIALGNPNISMNLDFKKE